MKISNFVAALAVACLLAMPASAVRTIYDFGVRFADTTDAGVNLILPNDNVAFPVNPELSQNVADSISADSPFGPTGISLTIQNDLYFNAFNGSNGSGTAAPTGDAAAFFSYAPDENLTSDALYGHTSVFGAGQETRPSVEYLIAGLDANGIYDFTFFADRGNGGGDRSAEYSVGGGSASLDVFENSSNVARVLGAQANASGELTLTIAPSATNNNSLGFFYLGAMEIATAVPEPASMLLMVLGGMGTLMVRRRS